MPKYAYKPIFWLSKHTKRQKNKNKLLLKITDDTNSLNVFEHNLFEVDNTSLSQYNPNIIVNENAKENLYERFKRVESIKFNVS
jgi:23S rRNA maturation-related 3'-5' exoribonuclease YhaM